MKKSRRNNVAIRNVINVNVLVNLIKSLVGKELWLQYKNILILQWFLAYFYNLEKYEN